MTYRVIKKNGQIEEFHIEKLERSIKNAASDLNMHLNISDLKLFTGEIFHKLKEIHGESNLTTSYEIIGITVAVMKSNKFHKLVASYLRV